MDILFWLIVIWLGVAFLWAEEQATSFRRGLKWPIELVRYLARVVGGL